MRNSPCIVHFYGIVCDGNWNSVKGDICSNVGYISFILELMSANLSEIFISKLATKDNTLQTIQQQLRGNTPTIWIAKLKIMIQAAQCIQFLHAKSIIHRDVTLATFLVRICTHIIV